MNVALALGTASAIAMVLDAVDPPPSYVDAPPDRYVNRKTISRFGAAYMVAVMWVCWRTGPLCTELLPPSDIANDPLLRAGDAAANALAAAVFVWGVAKPSSELSDEPEPGPNADVQTLLLRGSVAQNVIGATFLPVVLAMAIRGPEWWSAVHEQWPYQTLLEPSTSTFAGLSVDAGLLFLRIACRRKMTWEQVRDTEKRFGCLAVECAGAAWRA